MKKRIALALCMMLSLSLLLGSGPLSVQNSDLLIVSGEGDFSVVDGTVVYVHDVDGVRTGMFSRSQGSLQIELIADNGTYHVESWTIPSDPMNPQRVHEVMTITVGDDPIPPDPVIVDGLLLTELMASWGACSGACPFDLNGDGVVNGFDLVLLFTMWGEPWIG